MKTSTLIVLTTLAGLAALPSTANAYTETPFKDWTDANCDGYVTAMDPAYGTTA